MARRPRPVNGETPHQEVVATPAGQDLLDMAQMSPAERDLMMRIFRVTGTAAAAAMQVETERHEEAKPEFYGTAPTDLTRKFSTLPRPRQGAGLPPRRPE